MQFGERHARPINESVSRGIIKEETPGLIERHADAGHVGRERPALGHPLWKERRLFAGLDSPLGPIEHGSREVLLECFVGIAADRTAERRSIADRLEIESAERVGSDLTEKLSQPIAFVRMPSVKQRFPVAAGVVAVLDGLQ